MSNFTSVWTPYVIKTLSWLLIQSDNPTPKGIYEASAVIGTEIYNRSFTFVWKA
jgi:hypothetical protein